MRSSTLLLPLLSSLAAAQTILVFGTGDLPTCAETCTTLLDAQDVCVPSGGAPTTNQLTYDGCFCQSGYLTTLSTDDSTICDTTCTEQSERDEIQSWYKSFCSSVSASESDAATATTTATAAAATTTAATAATTTTTGTGTTSATSSSSKSTSTSSSTTNDANESASTIWWHAHARWIAMAIILLVAFIVIFVAGVLLKRRHRRRQQRASMTAPVVWGPHQNQAHTGGVNYNNPANSGMAMQEKGKQNVGILPTPNNGPVNYAEKDGQGKSGSRLKKFIGR